MNALLTFPATKRGSQLIRQRAVAEGYGEVTIASLIRSFKPHNYAPLTMQVRAHVRAPHMSATSPGAV